MFKICHFILFFILIIFVATSGVVSSPSLYNNQIPNNIEKAFATPVNEQEQQQLCTEGEVFNEETQMCETVEEEQQQQQQQQQPCPEGEVFNEETQMCETVEEEQQQQQQLQQPC